MARNFLKNSTSEKHFWTLENGRSIRLLSIPPLSATREKGPSSSHFGSLARRNSALGERGRFLSTATIFQVGVWSPFQTLLWPGQSADSVEKCLGDLLHQLWTISSGIFLQGFWAFSNHNNVEEMNLATKARRQSGSPSMKIYKRSTLPINRARVWKHKASVGFDFLAGGRGRLTL